MRKYWDEEQQFSQPSESLLKKNADESIKKQQKKGKEMHPIFIKGRSITKTTN